MSTDVPDEWIGLEQVAKELNITQRLAWELVRRLGVPMIEGGGRGKIENARFRRADWLQYRDASLRPVEPRRRYTVVTDVPPPAKPNLMTRANKLRASMREPRSK